MADIANSTRLMEKFIASVETRAFIMARIATGSSEDALDIVQDAMLRLVKSYRNKPESDWKPLFYRILQNLIKDWGRRRAIRNRLRIWLGNRPEDSAEERDNPIDIIPDPAGESPEEKVRKGDAMSALENALQKLPLRQRQAFLLRAWEGLDVRETALAMKCSSGSVKTHYSRAVHTLRNQLEDHWP